MMNPSNQVHPKALSAHSCISFRVFQYSARWSSDISANLFCKAFSRSSRERLKDERMITVICLLQK
jgi:hypothetical protein